MIFLGFVPELHFGWSLQGSDFPNSTSVGTLLIVHTLGLGNDSLGNLSSTTSSRCNAQCTQTLGNPVRYVVPTPIDFLRVDIHVDVSMHSWLNNQRKSLGLRLLMFEAYDP